MNSRHNWIVCFGGEDWWYHSHAHFDIQVMKQLSERTSILYVCSIGMRMPSIRKDAMFWKRINRKLRSVSRALKEVKPTLYVYSPLPIPLYQQNWGRTLNAVVLRTQLRIIYSKLGINNPLVWINTPTAWPVIKPMKNSGLIYQRTDDYAAYDFDNFNSEYVRSIDNELLTESDLILHVSEELQNEASKLTNRSMLLPQGVDNRFFDHNQFAPEDTKNIKRPIIGYIGGMDRHKFNTKLVSEVAAQLPECSFVLIGIPNPNVEILNNQSNVYFLGVKNHDEIPAYVNSFDMCMLPTAQTEWGLKCRPLKLMEYLASSKPVLATPTPASKEFSQHVFISDEPVAWVNEIKRFQKLGENMQKPEAQSLNLTTWSDIANIIWDRMSENNLAPDQD